MERECSECSQQMAADELELWKMVDIKGYAAWVTMLAAGLERLADDLRRQDEKHIHTSIQWIRLSVTTLHNRIRRIKLDDLKKFEKEFPIDLLETLTQTVPDQFEKILALMDELNPAVGQPELLERIQATGGRVVKILVVLAHSMRRHPGYRQARAQIPFEDRY